MSALDLIAVGFQIAVIVATAFACWLVLALLLDAHRVRSGCGGARMPERPQLRLAPRDEVAEARARRTERGIA